MTGITPSNHENYQELSLPLDACLRKAASAKAGGGLKWG